MASLNKVFLIGNLTRDPERRTTPAGTPVTDLGLAVNRRYRTQSGEDREETVFVTVSLFGKQADTAARYLRKGRSVFIEGRLRYEQWDSKDGQKRSRLSVVGERVQFLGGGGEGPSRMPMGDAPDRLEADTVPTEEHEPAGLGDDLPEDDGRDADNLPF